MSVYGPEEDSYFLKKFVEKAELKGRKVLDMGTGTGVVAVAAAKKGAEVTAADNNPEALQKAEENADKEGFDSIEFVETDLFENIEERFDFIFFNPPYLPGERTSDSDPLVGGEKGTEIIKTYLENADNHLRQGGEAYFIGSSKSQIEDIREKCDLKLVESKNLWFERLYLFKFRA